MTNNEMYKAIVKNLLIDENVKEVTMKDSAEIRLFDKVVVRGTSIEVYRHGLKTPSSEFFYDFGVDYATLLHYLEEDIFLTYHLQDTKHLNIALNEDGEKHIEYIKEINHVTIHHKN